MLPSKLIAGVVLAVTCALSMPALAQSVPDAAADDDAFLSLRDAARKDDAAKAASGAARLGAYPIPSYVEYYRLKPRIKDAAPVEIRDFLQRYAGSAIADRLRNDWLLELGRQRDWANFDAQYPQFVLNDDLQVKCYSLQSRALKGIKVGPEARALLLVPANYGEVCSGLIDTLAQAGQFDAEDLWTQLRLAGQFNATGVARRVMALLGGSDQHIGQAIDFPALALARGAGAGRAAHETYLVALGRMARTSHLVAALALRRAAPGLTTQEQALGWANIALQASYSLAPELAQYWQQARGAPLSLDAYQWKARSALRQGDWALVKADILAMPPVLRDDPAWIYWLGRALQAETPLVPNPAAQALFREIADQHQFYGQLAGEELGQRTSIPLAGPGVTQAELVPLRSNAGFLRAFKFFSMGLRFEGTREWNWELRKLSERAHLAAAELARQHNILDRMVNTSERTRTEVDYHQRFPAPHIEIVSPVAQTLGLDKAWVYGLIRQESRFVMDAQSRVGASGLMQVMPSTARYVARKLGLTDFAHHMMNDVRTNILLGVNYLNMVLGDLDGSQVMATAAYNAGPGRLRRWRATLTRPVEGAIFSETIPYSETRTYVKNVLSNATYYAALFENRPQSLKARLGTVVPKDYLVTDLPNPPNLPNPAPPTADAPEANPPAAPAPEASPPEAGAPERAQPGPNREER